MKYFVIIACLALLFLVGCDKREGDKPILTVIPGAQPLYNVANHDTINIACQLAGSSSVLYANQKINVIYDSAMGLFVGSGASNYLMTDTQGYAQGFFKVQNGYYGDIDIKLSPDHFPAQARTITIQAQDMPMITAFAATDSTLTTLDASTDISLSLTSNSDNKKNQWIKFFSSVGTSVEYDSVLTDTLGIANNIFHRNQFTGNATISAYLKIYPDDPTPHRLVVHCQ
jgi:hypothetical protein